MSCENKMHHHVTAKLSLENRFEFNANFRESMQHVIMDPDMFYCET